MTGWEEEDREEITKADLESLSLLVKHQLRLEADIETKEQELEDLRVRFRKISQQDIPNLLDRTGLSEITTREGYKVVVGTQYPASIPEANKEAAYSWLRDNGAASLIKRNVAVQFGKGEDGDAEELAAELHRRYHNRGLVVEDKSAVHPMTLRAYIKRAIEEDGLDIPFELFGVFPVRQTKVKRKK